MIYNDKQRRISAREVERLRFALEAAKTRARAEAGSPRMRKPAGLHRRGSRKALVPTLASTSATSSKLPTKHGPRSTDGVR